MQVNASKKAVSSTSGMETSVLTSPLLKVCAEG
jgi:mevalonate pyrophosphate decarboxylase